MIVRFSTRNGQLTMHGDAAVTLLRGMGHTGTVPGAILAADLPDALARLVRTLETSGGSPSPATQASSGEDDADERKREPVITLQMRAVPVLDMLRTAIAHDSDLMWERL